MAKVDTYGSGYLYYNNANAKVTENKKHGVAKNYKKENDTAYNIFEKLLQEDDNNSNVTIYVSNRTEKNAQGKELAGLSYDLADMFMKAAEAGYICDDDGKGFTRENALALGKKIAELDAKGEDYMDTSFRNMGIAKKPKDHRAYTRAEIFELLAAAGYSRAKAPEPVKVEEPPKQEEVKKPEPPKEEGGQVGVGTDLTVQAGARFTTEDPTSISEVIMAKLGISEAELKAIPFGGVSYQEVVDGKTVKGSKIEEVRFTYNGAQYMYRNGVLTEDDGTVAKEDQEKIDMAKKAPEPEIEINGKKYKQRYNEKTGELELKRKGFGLFRKWHTVQPQ